jgi:hypothetical protein
MTSAERLRPLLLTVGLAFLVVIAAWAGTVGVTAGLDTSWETALHMAAAEHLRAGHDWVYTYGPLGFASYPAWFGVATGAVSVLLNVALRVGFAYFIITIVRKRFSLVVGVIAAYLALIAWPLESSEVAIFFLAFVLCVVALSEGPMPRGALAAVATAAGVLATLKLNSAIVAVGYAALFAVRDGVIARRIATAVGAGTGAFLVVWLATGGRLTDIVEYFKNGVPVITGYTDASSIEASGVAWHYPVAIVLAIAIAIAARPAKGRGWFVAAFLVWTGYNQAKHAFVRHDAHALGYFATAAVIGVAIAATQRRTRAIVGVVIAVVAFGVGVQIRPLPNVRQPAHNARVAVSDIGAALTLSHRPVTKARAAARVAFAPEAALVTRTHDRGVHIEPNDAAIAFAYGEKWTPLPSFQELLTYAPALDQLNVRRIEHNPPPFVLLDTAAPAFEMRLPDLNAPASRLALLCRYDAAESRGQWLLLRARAETRCGKPSPLARFPLSPSHSVDVPAPRHGGIVVARLHLGAESAKHRLLSLLWKPSHYPSLIVDQTRYRLVRALAEGPFIVVAPAAAPFGPGSGIRPGIHQIGASGYGGGPATIEFEEVPYAIG